MNFPELTERGLVRMDSTTLQKLEEELLVVDAERLAKSFREFIPEAFAVLEPETPFEKNWHIDAIADHLEAVSRGQIRNLLINIPPRHMKSLEASVMWPAWEWTQTPQRGYMCASYAANLALRDAVKMRDLIVSDWYQDRWADVFMLAEDQNQKSYFKNNHGGIRVSGGVGGPQTGEGGDRVIIDDAHKTQEFESEVALQTVRDWWDGTMISRLKHPKTVAKVVIGQRIAAMDLPGHLLDSQDGWVHLNLPTEYEEKPFVYVNAKPSPIGWSDPRREEGELMWPSRFGEAEIAPLKARSFFYAAQHQQHPTPKGGSVIKEDWWKRYKIAPAKFSQVLQSWDMTFKNTTKSDFVCGQVWARIGGEFYLLDQEHGRMDFVSSCKALERMTRRHPKVLMKLIEDKANGPAIIAQLKRTVSGLIAVEPMGSKEARLSSIAPLIEAGNVYIPEGQIGDDLIAEANAFRPNGASHDDRLDAMSQALIRLSGVRGFDLAGYAALLEKDAEKPEAAEVVGKAPATPVTPPNTSRMTIIRPDVYSNVIDPNHPHQGAP
jgi:predicted phage terminase large subunit-like protein